MSNSRDAMTCARIPAARFARVVPEFSALENEGAGNAGRPMRPIAACAMLLGRSAHALSGHTGITRHSPRNGLRLIRDLPGDRAFLPPSPLGSLLPGSLTPASGCQDHTTSPSASRAIRQERIRVHRIPPRVRDDREPPLSWDGTESRYSCFYPAVK